MSFFPTDDNCAVSYNLAADGIRWKVNFSRPLVIDMAQLREIGYWISENIPGGGEIEFPDSYLFGSEQDALLVYLRFK